jgi:hypothetical protein
MPALKRFAVSRNAASAVLNLADTEAGKSAVLATDELILGIISAGLHTHMDAQAVVRMDRIPMRFDVRIRRSKLTARRLKKSLLSRGFAVTHCFCLDLAARLYGYADYHELCQSQDGLDESSWDHVASGATVASRRAFQKNILKAAGYASTRSSTRFDRPHPLVKAERVHSLLTKTISIGVVTLADPRCLTILKTQRHHSDESADRAIETNGGSQ